MSGSKCLLLTCLKNVTKKGYSALFSNIWFVLMGIVGRSDETQEVVREVIKFFIDLHSRKCVIANTGQS